MPRLQRRSRLKQSGLPVGGTRWQILLWADAILPSTDPGFRDDIEARTMWREHRAALMAECQPGMRPAAYFRVELSVTDVVSRWHQQLNVLLDRNLIGPDEAVLIEHVHRELSGQQSPHLYSSFDSADTIRAMRLGSDGNEMAATFKIASRWHAWRGREELAERYAHRLEMIRQAFRSVA